MTVLRLQVDRVNSFYFKHSYTEERQNASKSGYCVAIILRDVTVLPWHVQFLQICSFEKPLRFIPEEKLIF